MFLNGLGATSTLAAPIFSSPVIGGFPTKRLVTIPGSGPTCHLAVSVGESGPEVPVDCIAVACCDRASSTGSLQSMPPQHFRLPLWGSASGGWGQENPNFIAHRGVERRSNSVYYVVSMGDSSSSQLSALPNQPTPAVMHLQ